MKWHIIEIKWYDEDAHSRSLEFDSLEEAREYVEDNMTYSDIWFLCHGDVYELYGPATIEEVEE